MTDDNDDAARALAAARATIRARHWPPGEEDGALAAAARYVVGDLDLSDAAEAVRAGEAALAMARAELRGAAVAAVATGVPKLHVAYETGLSRATLDYWLKPKV